MREAQATPDPGEAPAKAQAVPYRMIEWGEQQRLLGEAERMRAAVMRAAFLRLKRAMAGAMAGAIAAVRRREQRRGGLHELLALDDHTLADIGLHRAELQAVVQGLVRWEEVFVPRAGGNAAEVVRLPERARPERPARELDTAA
jgi:uncharacterized protein YjiS (DUF1127 family)